MLKWYWVVAALVGVLWYRNARFAIREYLSQRNYAVFCLYMVFLLILGYLIIHMTSRMMSLAQASQSAFDALN